MEGGNGEGENRVKGPDCLKASLDDFLHIGLRGGVRVTRGFCVYTF